MEDGNMVLHNDKDVVFSGKMNQTRMGRVKQFLRNNLLILLTIVSVVVGFAIGLAVRPYRPTPEAIMWIGFLGEIFLRLLMMIIVPLIVTSVISSTASLDAKASGKIGGFATAAVIVFNTLGAITGTLLGAAIKSGRAVTIDADSSQGGTVTSSFETGDIIADLFRNIFPDNLLRSAMQKTSTAYTDTVKVILVNTSDGMLNQTFVEHRRTLEYVDSVNILGLIVVSAMFGIATGSIGEKGKPFLYFFQAATDVIFVVLRWFFWFVPIGIASLIAETVAGLEDIGAVASGLALFVAVNFLGHAILMVLLVPGLYAAVTRTKPFRLMMLQIRVLILAATTSTSAAVIPEHFKLADRLRLDRRITSFVIPYNATIMRSGSALFIALSSLFTAQMYAIDLTAAQYMLICFLTAVCSLAIPAVHSSSIVAIVIVLTNIGIPSEAVGILFATEWVLDRIRTVSNNCTGVFVVNAVHHHCQSDFGDDDDRNRKEYDEECDGGDDGTVMMSHHVNTSTDDSKV